MNTKILIIEDDPALQELLRQVLSRAGYEVEVCRDGDDAPKQVLAFRPDLAIVDWDLPGLNGVQITRFIRSTPVTSHIPVLMMTAYNHVSHKINAFDVGVTEYITKPFNLKELLIRVHTAFRKRVRPCVK